MKGAFDMNNIPERFQPYIKQCEPNDGGTGITLEDGFFYRENPHDKNEPLKSSFTCVDSIDFHHKIHKVMTVTRVL